MSDGFIITFISFIWFVTGFFVGYINSEKKDMKEFIDETGKTIKIEAKKLMMPSAPTGRIKPITAQEAWKRSQTPERKEAQEAMKETLDTIPDLVKAKELLQSMKQEEYQRG